MSERVESRGTRIAGAAGVIGEGGWAGEIVTGHRVLADVLAAAERWQHTVTLDRLVPGDRYRVKEDIKDLRRGMTVRFVGFHDIDNHYGEYVFEGEDGAVLKVGGDFCEPRRRILAETHRYLVRA
jgi:hypothetical protein